MSSGVRGSARRNAGASAPREEGRLCGGSVIFVRTATRPVDGVRPSQVPFDWVSRPERTRCASEGELEFESLSKEWNAAASAGRARYSSRFAHRILQM